MGSLEAYVFTFSMLFNEGYALNGGMCYLYHKRLIFFLIKK